MASSERKTFLLRLPPDLWAELETWASDELRSVNGQIEFLLRAAVRRRKGVSGESSEAESIPASRRR